MFSSDEDDSPKKEKIDVNNNMMQAESNKTQNEILPQKPSITEKAEYGIKNSSPPLHNINMYIYK